MDNEEGMIIMGTVRDISDEEARKEIMEYIENKVANREKVFICDIIADLWLDWEQVIRVIKNLPSEYKNVFGDPYEKYE